MNDILSLGKHIGLEVSYEDMEELPEEHRYELSTQELEQLQRQLKKTTLENVTSEEEEGRHDIPTCLIREILAKQEELLSFEERYIPNISVNATFRFTKVTSGVN